MTSTQKPFPHLNLINTTAALVLITLIVYILYVGKSLLLPLIIALVIWYIIIQFTVLFHKIRIGRFRLPNSISLTLSILLAGATIYIFIMLLTSSIGNIISETPQYQAKLKTIFNYFNQLTANRLDITKLFGKIDLSSMFSAMAVVLSNVLGSFTLVLIYLLFLLLEAKTFNSKLKVICKNKTQYEKVDTILQRIHNDINTFLKAKLLINAVAGIASYITLLFFHVHYAEFWGMVIFLFHFIPFIGPIVSVIFVMIAVSVQISSLIPFLILAAILIAIQLVVGNVLEPKMMGNRLNLSPIVILISLAFWGYVWGIIGMFLSVPLMVIINIIFAHFPQTNAIAVILSSDHKALEFE